MLFKKLGLNRETRLCEKHKVNGEINENNKILNETPLHNNNSSERENLNLNSNFQYLVLDFSAVNYVDTVAIKNLNEVCI